MDAILFLGQELRDIVSGLDTIPPSDVNVAKRRKVKVGKTIYALSVTVEDEFLLWIKNAKIAKEAWDMLVTIFY